jgi:hypothetical protein
LLAIVASIAVPSLGAAPALAETFTVCASGCAYKTITEANAAPAVHSGDDLLVGPGTYTDEPVLTKVLSVRGDASLPRPVLAPPGQFSVGLTLGAGSAGSVVSHLALALSGGSSGGIGTEAPGTFSDLTVTAARIFLIGAADTTVIGMVANQTTNLGDVLVQPATTLRHVQVSFPAQEGGLLLTSFSGAGTVIEDSTFTSPATNSPLGVNLLGTPAEVTLRRVRVESAGTAAIVAGPATITDTLATATAGEAISAVGLPGGGPVLLRNVTAVSAGRREGRPSYGLEALGCLGSGCTAAVVAARDVIARGLDADVAADPPGGSPGTAGTLTIDHSNFVTTHGAVTATMNQSSDPLFVNGSIGPSENFRLLAGSPAIDAGVTDAFTGPSDLDGNPRVQGAAIDLGAYEFAPPPPAPAVGPGPALPPAQPAKPPAAKLALLARTVGIDSRRGTGRCPPPAPRAGATSVRSWAR